MRKYVRTVIVGLFLGSTCLFTACESDEKKNKQEAEPIDTDGYRIYTIKQGNHYADNREAGEIKTQKLNFMVKFDSSAIYKTIDPVNQFDINKLYGLSDCKTAHHQNSARMGWAWVNDQLEIYGYGYKSGVRNSEFIKAIPLGQAVAMSIEMNDSTYLLRVEDKFVELPRGCNGIGEGYKLFPYFGGDETAPHTITIRVKDL